MSIGVAPIQSMKSRDLDRFVVSSLGASPYHLSAWRDAIAAAYGHCTVGAVATRREVPASVDGPKASAFECSETSESDESGESGRPVGMLALVHLRHWLFGSRYVSMPFCDWTGMLADDADTGWMLLRDVLAQAQAQRVGEVEIRQDRPFDLRGPQPGLFGDSDWSVADVNKESKVRMVLDLPNDAESLMRGFRSKLRSQIRKPIKEGLVVRSGGRELIGDFYRVFVENMRDLGSPVHSRRLLEEVVDRFGDHARVFVVYGDRMPMAGAVSLGLGDVLYNPWASALRRHVERSPNMLLYWAMLEFACGNGYRRFDFGRSTPNEGTYRFKEQWGARPVPIYWYRFSFGTPENEPVASSKSRFTWAMEGWKHLPVGVTRMMGPLIRRHISL